MANDLTTTDRADQSRAVAAFASSSTWTLSEAMNMAANVELFPLLARYERGLVPLKEAEPDPQAPSAKLSIGLADDLAMLLTKVAPTMSTDQADSWIKVMMIALGNLPGRVAREAAQAAMYRHMKFPNEIEDVVRQLAEGLMARHRLACARLLEMAAEGRRRELATEGEPEELSDEEIRRLKPEFISLGIRCGALSQERVDRAFANAPPDQQAA